MGQLLRWRHPVGDTSVADLRFGPHDALGERRRRDEEGTRDILGGQTADLTQGKRGLRFRGYSMRQND